MTNWEIISAGEQTYMISDLCVLIYREADRTLCCPKLGTPFDFRTVTCGIGYSEEIEGLAARVRQAWLDDLQGSHEMRRRSVEVLIRGLRAALRAGFPVTFCDGGFTVNVDRGTVLASAPDGHLVLSFSVPDLHIGPVLSQLGRYA